MMTSLAAMIGGYAMVDDNPQDHVLMILTDREFCYKCQSRLYMIEPPIEEFDHYCFVCQCLVLTISQLQQAFSSLHMWRASNTIDEKDKPQAIVAAVPYVFNFDRLEE